MSDFSSPPSEFAASEPTQDQQWQSPDTTIVRGQSAARSDINEPSEELIIAPETRRPVAETSVYNRAPDLKPEQPSIEIAPRFELVGPDRDIPGMEEFVHSCIAKWQSRGPYPKERTPTPDDNALIQSVGSAVIQLGQGLGIDVSSRLLPPKAHHIFDKRKDYNGALGKPPRDEGTNGLWRIDEGLFLLRSGPQYALTAAHETAHSLSRIALRPVVTQEHGEYVVERFVISAGYTPEPRITPTLEGINEIATELAVDHASYALGHDYVPPHTRGYMGLSIVGSAAIQAAAKAHGMPPDELEEDMLYGFFSGDHTVLEPIEDALGPERTMIFRGLTGRESDQEMMGIAHQLGLPAAVINLEKMRDHKPFEPYPWRPSIYGPR